MVGSANDLICSCRKKGKSMEIRGIFRPTLWSVLFSSLCDKKKKRCFRTESTDFLR